MILVAKILLTIAAIQFGFIPLIVDFTETHVFHPDWPPHARFHLVWLLCLGAALSLYIIYTIWIRSKQHPEALRQSSLIGCIVLSAFFVAAIFKSVYGGSLTDLKEPLKVFGIDGNVFSFSIASLFQILGTAIAWNKTKYI